MPRRTHADWASAAHRFVEARAARDAYRELRGCPELDTESDADDSYVPRFVNINVNIVPQAAASASSVRENTNLLTQTYQRQVNSAVTNNIARGSTRNAIVAPRAFNSAIEVRCPPCTSAISPCLTEPQNTARDPQVPPPRPPKPAALQPVRHLPLPSLQTRPNTPQQPPREIPPVRAPQPVRPPLNLLLTRTNTTQPPAPITPPRAHVKVETIDLTASTPRAPAPRTSIVVVRELGNDGRLVMLRETTLAQAVEVVALSLPGCVGLRDREGVVDERRWRGRPLVMTVAVEWEW